MLSPALLDQILGRLAVRYGSQWLRQWEGLDPQAIRNDWGDTLEHVTELDIAYAMHHLPIDWPPNAGQFRELCRQRTVPTQNALGLPPPPRVEPSPGVRARLAALLAGIGKPKPDDDDGRRWARELKRREEAGQFLSIAQQRAWREALGNGPTLLTAGEADALVREARQRFKGVTPSRLNAAQEVDDDPLPF